MKKLTAPLVLLVVLTAYVTNVHAASTKMITESFDTTGLERLELNISIAELDIEIYEGDTVDVEILLEGERRFFGFSREDVDDIDLAQDVMGSALYLTIEDRDIEQHWLVRVPAKLALEVELGVGEVSVEGVRNALDMEVGVGEVRVSVFEEAINEIWLDVGVGDAIFRGMNERVDNERSFISDGARYFGQGEHNIRIDLGVGEVRVRGE